MDLTQIIITFMTACVPSLITYFITKKEYATKIKELEIHSSNELKRIEKESEVRLKELQSNNNLELTNKFLNNELDLDKLLISANKLNKIQKTINKFSK